MNIEYIIIAYLFACTPLFFTTWVVGCIVEYTSEWRGPDGYDSGWEDMSIALVVSCVPIFNLFLCWMLYCNIKNLIREKPWRKTVMLSEYEVIGVPRDSGGVPVVKRGG